MVYIDRAVILFIDPSKSILFSILFFRKIEQNSIFLVRFSSVFRVFFFLGLKVAVAVSIMFVVEQL